MIHLFTESNFCLKVTNIGATCITLSSISCRLYHGKTLVQDFSITIEPKIGNMGLNLKLNDESLRRFHT